MSNDRVGRYITTKLNGHWKNHPGQRDFVHGTYHAAAGTMHGGIGALLALGGNKNTANFAFDRARKDFIRTHDHWIKGENRNNRTDYNPSPPRRPGCLIF